MPSANTLQDLYTQELRDLVSANEQMQKIVDRMHARANDQKFKKLLENSVGGISQHTETLRSLIQGGGGESTECRGMAGLVEEADRHAIQAEMPQELRDVAMIAQYQRMSHYGVAGFGTAAAYAKALGKRDDASKLSQIVSDIYRADEYTSQLAEAAEQAAARK